MYIYNKYEHKYTYVTTALKLWKSPKNKQVKTGPMLHTNVENAQNS